MKVMVAHNEKLFEGQPIENYARSMIRSLKEKGHEVVEVKKMPLLDTAAYKQVDLLLDIDCGRDDNGKLRWHGEQSKPPVKSTVYLIDSHGYPDMHKKLARKYDHVFFAVYSRRDLFAGHPSAHWCPNFTDDKWFDRSLFAREVKYDFGFFGSKHGLDRADPMKEIAERRGWTYRIAQVRKQEKPRWPYTGEAMSECRVLFNHGQKHDGPNLRVMESMLVGKPLMNNVDSRDGMHILFTPWVHYLPYGSFDPDKGYSYGDLEEVMAHTQEHPNHLAQMAEDAYNEVKTKHLVGNRIDQILEVANAD